MEAPDDIAYAKADENDGAVSLDALSLLPSIPWHEQMEPHWDVSETGAREGADPLS